MGKKPFSRKVQDLGNGTNGLSFPEALANRHGVEIGDEVVFEYDPDSAKLTYHLE